jgi:tRNA G26 N,N-dimethylase Trm1
MIMNKESNSMIEVFKTNVMDCNQAERMLALLVVHIKESRINFDLHDCDKILRVEANQIVPEKIIELMNTHGYQCMVLE